MVNEENCCGHAKFMIVYFYSLAIQTVENFSGRQEYPSWFIGKHPLKLLPCIELIIFQSILLKFNMFLLYWCFLILPFRSNGCSSTFGFFCCCWYIYVYTQFVSDCTIIINVLNPQVQHWQNQYSSLESESEVALQAAAEDKERTVADVREAMKSSMHNLQNQYDVMCQKVGVLGSLYSDLTESYILIEKQAKQFPKIIKKTVTDVTKQVCFQIWFKNVQYKTFHSRLFQKWI